MQKRHFDVLNDILIYVQFLNKLTTSATGLSAKGPYYLVFLMISQGVTTGCWSNCIPLLCTCTTVFKAYAVLAAAISWGIVGY